MLSAVENFPAKLHDSYHLLPPNFFLWDSSSSSRCSLGHIRATGRFKRSPALLATEKPQVMQINGSRSQTHSRECVVAVVLWKQQ